MRKARADFTATFKHERHQNAACSPEAAEALFVGNSDDFAASCVKDTDRIVDGGGRRSGKD